MRLKAWFLRWLGALSEAEFSAIRAGDNQCIRDEYRAVISELKAEHESAMAKLIEELKGDNQCIRDEYRAVISELKAEHESAMAKLIEELNTLRNSRTVAQNAQGQVRVLRNFREFRETIEHPRQKKGTA